MYIVYIKQDYLDKYEEMLDIDKTDPLIVYHDGEEYSINMYAWTLSKKKVKQFLLYRKPEMFGYIEYGLSDADLVKYKELEILNSYMLDDIYHIPITAKESMNVFSMVDEFYIVIYDIIETYVDINIFKKKFRNLLAGINYIKYIGVSVDLNNGADISIIDNIVRDELSQFKLFKFIYFDTLREEVLTLT